MWTIDYICTHGWDIRDRGNTVQKNKTYRGMNCKAGFKVALVENGDPVKKVSVMIKTQYLGHNHPLRESTFKHYAENRRVEDADLLKGVIHLRTMRAPIRKIVRWLREETGKYCGTSCGSQDSYDSSHEKAN